MLRTLILLLVLFSVESGSHAESPADEPVILLTELKTSDALFSGAPHASFRAELRDALAAYLRTHYGSVTLPVLSEEEHRCRDAGCAVKIAQRYDAALLIVPSINPNALDPSQCDVSLMVLRTKTPLDGDSSFREPLRATGSSLACASPIGALQREFERVSDELLSKRAQLTVKSPPICRYRYDSTLRGLGIGTGIGLALAGAGLGIGSIAETQKTFTSPDGRDSAGFKYSPERDGLGFGVMAAGLVLGGSSLIPWERISNGPNLEGCIPPAQGRFGMIRTAATSFFASSALSSLISVGYFAAQTSVLTTPAGVSGNFPSGYLAGSSAMLGVYSIGLIISIAIP